MVTAFNCQTPDYSKTALPCQEKNIFFAIDFYTHKTKLMYGAEKQFFDATVF